MRAASTVGAIASLLLLTGADPPATLTKVNLAATEIGGGIERITGFVGPGFTGRRLLDGRPAPAWKLDWFKEIEDEWRPVYGPEDPSGSRVPKELNARIADPKYPLDFVFSFYDRQAALVGAVVIVLPEGEDTLPQDVEVWTALNDAADEYEKAAERSLSAQPAEQILQFPARDARYVKLRVLSGTSEADLAIAEVRVLESARAGYVPLMARAKGAKNWKGSPRDAAQRGLEWLQQASVNWWDYNGCFGCHVQGQVIMGQDVAQRNGYRVNRSALGLLTQSARANAWETPAGWAFAGMALARANPMTGTRADPAMQTQVDNLLKQQAKAGYFTDPQPHLPIVQGAFDVTGNALVAFDWAGTHGGKPAIKAAASRALAWMAAAAPKTTQDKVYKIISLMRFAPDKRDMAWALVDKLAIEQQPDGGWKETAEMMGSNAFATGQVLYAYQQAGVSVLSPTFRRGVDYLLKSQVNDPTPDNGIWHAINTQSPEETELAPTMWAVIGLAAAYGEDRPGALQVGEPQTGRPPIRNLEIILDVSGSMNAKLGKTTRWQTALDVLKKSVATIPADFNVALRVYGHRHPSKSAETCTDTELIVPMAKLDRERIVDAASSLKPRGETPLIFSTLQTLEDLKAAGGGTVILITDGEESCKGDSRTAAAAIRESGLEVTLNIVGFTLTGQAVTSQLTELAGSTGGRYFSAASGDQLSQAVRLAALPRMPYDLLDASGQLVASGQTGEPSRELPAGDYVVRVKAPEQVIEQKVTITPEQMKTLSFAFEGDKLAMRAK
jgi:hypothetical protein